MYVYILFYSGANRFSYDISSVHWGSNVLSLEKFKTFDSLIIYCEIDKTATDSICTNMNIKSNENVLLNSKKQCNYVMYKQFNNAMSQMYEEIRNIQNVININAEKTHNVLNELKKQIIELNKCQSYNENEINKIWNTINQKNMCNNTETVRYDAIKKWLHELKLLQYYKIFIENGYDDVDCIKDMNDNDLKIIGINKMGHRKKIIKSLNNIYNSIDSPLSYDNVSNISTKSDSRKQDKINKILKIKKISYNERNKIKKWLNETVKLGQYFELLIKNGYDTFESIYDITFNDLAEIGINKMGHRKIIKYISKLMKQKQFLFPIKNKSSRDSPNSQISQLSNHSNGSQSHSSLLIYSTNNKNIWSDDSNNKNNS